MRRAPHTSCNAATIPVLADFKSLLGLDTLYRLERLSGRYGDAASERRAPRTVPDLDTSATALVQPRRWGSRQ